MSKKISELTAATSIASADLLAVVQGGVTKKITYSSLISNKSDFRNYKVYTILISQSGAAAPTVIELENTVGAVVWTRSSAGLYIGTLSGAFTVDKTFIIANLWSGETVALLFNSEGAFFRNDVNSVAIQTLEANVSKDGLLGKTPVEIRVYP